MSAPWLKFYPRDWRGDQALRATSIGARGLWMECLCIMHEAKPYGYLLINGEPVKDHLLARMTGIPGDELGQLMKELHQAGVPSVSRDGVIFSRRMVADARRAASGRKSAEKRWGVETKGENGRPNGSPIGSPITQIAERKEEEEKERKKDAAVPAPINSAEFDLFRRGKEILGEHSGGLINKLLGAKNKNVALARSAIEVASTKENPREYVGAIVRGQSLRATGDAW